MPVPSLARQLLFLVLAPIVQFETKTRSKSKGAAAPAEPPVGKKNKAPAPKALGKKSKKAKVAAAQPIPQTPPSPPAEDAPPGDDESSSSDDEPDVSEPSLDTLTRSDLATIAAGLVATSKVFWPHADGNSRLAAKRLSDPALWSSKPDLVDLRAVVLSLARSIDPAPDSDKLSKHFVNKEKKKHADAFFKDIGVSLARKNLQPAASNSPLPDVSRACKRSDCSATLAADYAFEFCSLECAQAAATPQTGPPARRAASHPALDPAALNASSSAASVGEAVAAQIPTSFSGLMDSLTHKLNAVPTPGSATASDMSAKLTPHATAIVLLSKAARGEYLTSSKLSSLNGGLDQKEPMNRLCKAVYADLKNHIQDFPNSDPPVDLAWVDKFAVGVGTRMEQAIKDHITCSNKYDYLSLSVGAIEDVRRATIRKFVHSLSAADENMLSKGRVKSLTYLVSNSVNGLNLRDLLDKHAAPASNPYGGPSAPSRPPARPMLQPPPATPYTPYMTGNGALNNPVPANRYPPGPPGAGGPNPNIPRTALFGLFPQGHYAHGFKEAGPNACHRCGKIGDHRFNQCQAGQPEVDAWLSAANVRAQ